MTDVIPYEEKVGALSVHDVRGQVNLIQQVMREVMQKDVHYGVIPGTGTKPTLYKAGAEKLCLTFRLDPQYEIKREAQGEHLTVVATCTLYHIPTGQRYGSGLGMCSSKESRYAFRKASRLCPECKSESIIKGRDEYGGGWLCFKKKGGCGAKFVDGDPAIESQAEGRVPNEDVEDQHNTVLKMACKRALVAAILNTTAASDIFTQDLEDTAFSHKHGDVADAEIVEPVSPKPSKRPRKPADGAGEPPDYWASIAEATTLDELQAIWGAIPVKERPEYLASKDARKSALSTGESL